MLTDMLTPKNGLLLLLAAFGLAYVDAWARATPAMSR